MSFLEALTYFLLGLGLLAILVAAWARYNLKRTQEQRRMMWRIIERHPNRFTLSMEFSQVHESWHWWQLMLFRNPMRIYTKFMQQAVAGGVEV